MTPSLSSTRCSAGLKWGILLVYAVVTFLGVWFHEPWRDELQAWIIARDLDVPGIIYQMRYEGHFSLWSLLLHPFAAGGAPLIVLGLISWAFLLVAAGLWLFRAPFALYAKIAFLLSFPMIYYFPVVSRCYALVPPILFGMAALYGRLPRYRLWYCTLLGLLAHTHVYMEGMVAVLFLIYGYDCILKPWRRMSFCDRCLSVTGALLTLGLVLLAFLQVFPAFEVRGDVGRYTYSLEKTFEVMEQTIVPDVALWVRIVEYVLLAVLAGWFFSRYKRGYNLRIPLIVIGAVAWQIFFSMEIYPMMLQRAYLFLFVLVFAMWIMQRQRPLLGMVVTLLSLMTLHKLPLAYKDIYRPYSNAAEIAELLDRFVPEGGVVAVDNLSKVITAYRPNYRYVSICDLKPALTYGPHLPCRYERVSAFSTKVMQGEGYYYVRSHIGLARFARGVKKLEGSYTVKRLALEGAKTPLQESYYLYSVQKK